MSYKQLTSEERYVIYHLRLADFSYREIGRRLNRHHSTIIREVQRNGLIDMPYWNEAAQEKANERHHKARHYRKRSNDKLFTYVIGHIQQDWSPEAISGRLKLEYPNDYTMRMSAEGIYYWIYEDAAQKGCLFHHLRRRHKKRKKQRKYGTGRGLIADRVSIDKRPDIVNARSRFGDWEGDIVEGAKGAGGIATLVERKSRYLLAAKLSDKQAKTMTTQTIKAFRITPKHLRKTLTVDNGKEFADFKQIESQTSLSIFFADPYSAWQRGTNENTNGLLRQYFPKGTKLSAITEKYLALVVKNLNNRPRKCLSYRTSRELYLEASRGALAT